MSTARCLPLTVLVVDDSDLICERLCALLDESPRLRVVGAVRDGADALLTWELLHPAAVVLDIQLPGLGGLELLRRIKSATPQ